MKCIFKAQFVTVVGSLWEEGGQLLKAKLWILLPVLGEGHGLNLPADNVMARWGGARYCSGSQPLSASTALDGLKGHH